jgi:hypothetical protein
MFLKRLFGKKKISMSMVDVANYLVDDDEDDKFNNISDDMKKEIVEFYELEDFSDVIYFMKDGKAKLKWDKKHLKNKKVSNILSLYNIWTWDWFKMPNNEKLKRIKEYNMLKKKEMLYVDRILQEADNTDCSDGWLLEFTRKIKMAEQELNNVLIS